MRRVTGLLTAAAVFLVGSAGIASASPVNEVEGNDSLTQAQNIDAYFTLDANPEINNSTTVPHATVLGTGNETFDYYAFTVPQAGAGSLGVLDIDGGMFSFDSWLTLFDGSGTVLAEGDDSFPIDPGSAHQFDSFIRYNFPHAGTYYIRVGRYCCPSPVPQGATYRLHVSVPHHSTDSTPPVLSLPADSTHEATGSDGDVVTYSATASDDHDGSVPVDCLPASGSTFRLGTTTVSCSATDATGNTSSGIFRVTVQDTTAPALDPMADVTATATGPSGATVTYTQPAANDLVDGSVPVQCAPASGSTFAAGDTTVECTAVDTRGNLATDSFEVHVRYGFRGLFAPVNSGGAFNTVKAGRAIPVKFDLSGDMGLSIFQAGSPASQRMACDTSASQDALEQTVTAGESGLSYDALTGQYNYVWKSDSSWAGTCRQLTVTLQDGTQQTANFAFK